MVSERELIGLLYRADWTKLTLSGTVTGADPVTDNIILSDHPLSGPWQRDDDEAPLPPPRWLFGGMPSWMVKHVEEAWEARRGPAAEPSWGSAPGSEGATCTLAVAPGQRFRAEGPDGAWALGYDGTRLWQWLRDRPVATSFQFDLFGTHRPQAPYRALLAPSWLLTGYSLVLNGEATVAGRNGVRIRGTVRPVAERATRVGGQLGRSAGAGGILAPIPRWLNSIEPEDEQVEAVVDAELGILLRCSRWSADTTPRVTEFVSLDVPGTAGDAAFTAPAGSTFSGANGGFWTRGPQARPAAGTAGTSLGDAVGGALGGALGAAGKEAAKTVAGIAAGGLGALLKYGPSRQRVDPFAQAAAEAADPEADMPADETAPGEPAASAPDSEALPDEVLQAVYRSGLAGPSFGATLHQWSDAEALLAAVPQSARGKGFGGVGLLVDALRENAQQATAGASHAMSTVRMGGWREYRIDIVQPASDAAFFSTARRDQDRARTIASDGERQWQVLADRVVTGPATPPPSELADLVDASWLLDPTLDLSDGSETWLGGRRAYRIVARYRDDAATGFDWWKRLFFPAVAVVDAETGLALRLTRFKGGRPTMRQELRDVTALDAGAGFGFTPPAGLRVDDAGALHEEDGPGSRAWTWNWDPPALQGDVCLGASHRGSQLAEEHTGAVGGVAD